MPFTLLKGSTLIVEGPGHTGKAVLKLADDAKFDATAHPENIGVKHEIPPERSGTVLDRINATHKEDVCTVSVHHNIRAAMDHMRAAYDMTHELQLMGAVERNLFELARTTMRDLNQTIGREYSENELLAAAEGD